MQVLGEVYLCEHIAEHVEHLMLPVVQVKYGYGVRVERPFCRRILVILVVLRRRVHQRTYYGGERVCLLYEIEGWQAACVALVHACYVHRRTHCYVSVKVVLLVQSCADTLE